MGRKKWVQKLLCSFAVMALMGMCLSPAARAETGVSTQNADADADTIKVKITGIEVLAVYPSTHESVPNLAEMYFTTDTVWAGEGTNADKTIQVNARDVSSTVNTNGSSGLLMQHWGGADMDNGHIVTIPAGLQFQAGGVMYETAADFSFKYTKGTDFTNGIYEIVDISQPSEPVAPAYTDVTVQGIVLEIAGGIYLGVGQTEGNANYITEAVSVISGTQSETKISAIALEGGNLFIPWTASEGDILRIDKDGTAVDSSKNAGLKFLNEYVLRYDGESWKEVCTNITLSGITAQSAVELYMTTGLGSDHVLYAEGSTYISSGISITKKDGTIRTIGKMAVDKNTGAFCIAVYEAFEEGDILKVQAGRTAINAVHGCVMKFTDKMVMYYEDGAWHMDCEGPEFYYNDKVVTDSTVITVNAGRSKASFESLLKAIDENKGNAVDFTITYAKEALDNNNALCAGIWTITLTAKDEYGNQTVQTVELIVSTDGLPGDSDHNDILNVTDLVRIKKAAVSGTADTALYDMNGDDCINAADAQYLRCVMAGKYSIVAGRVVQLPAYSGSAVLFADWPSSQLKNETVREYFDAGFTHMQMTEDYTALTYNGNTPYKDYTDAIRRIQKYGEVMIRNQLGHADYFQNTQEQTVGNYTIPVRNLTTEFADLGVQSFYYWDEPAASDFTKIEKLVKWHNTYNKGAMFHVNLLPSYGNTAAFTGSYEDYIHAYVDQVLAKVDGKKTLSIDNYPLRYEYGSKFIRYSYLSDLLTVAQAVKNFNKENPNSSAEVSLCIQSYGVESGTKGNRQIESLADIRFQANMAIAIGARNLEYYMYKGTYGMVWDGNKTQVYDYVKTVNKEVQAWDHVFTSFNWQGTKMFGDTSSGLYSTAAGKFADSFTKAAASADKAAIVSEFMDDYGNYAYMAVNATEPSEGKTVNMTLTFAGAKQAVVYKNGAASVQTLTNGTYTAMLEAGAGVFCIPLY